MLFFKDNRNDIARWGQFGLINSNKAMRGGIEDGNTLFFDVPK